ncbi:MAG: hypothetical protein KKA75_05385, partial [Proteobacteria bacterium]|nr:hypothetical protein [Pseudomonadota bacterium]
MNSGATSLFDVQCSMLDVHLSNFGGYAVSLNESPDCKIEKIIRADATEVIALASVHLDDEQLQYFLRNKDCLTTD